MKFVCSKWHKCDNYRHSLPCHSPEWFDSDDICVQFEPKEKPIK